MPGYQVPVAIGVSARISLIRKPRTPVSHGRGHWFDPSTAHHLESSRARSVRQSDREPLADRHGRLLDCLEQNIGIPRVEEPLELAAARSHPLCHLTLAQAFFLHSFSHFPGQHSLPGECRHLFVKPLGLQELVERGAQMLISPSCHFPPPSVASPPDPKCVPDSGRSLRPCGCELRLEAPARILDVARRTGGGS